MCDGRISDLRDMYVTVMHDDSYRGRVSRRVIYRLTFMFTYRNARFIALKKELVHFMFHSFFFLDFCWIFFLEVLNPFFLLLNNLYKNDIFNVGDI